MNPLAPSQLSRKDLARWQEAQQQLLGGQHNPALVAYRKLAQRYPSVPELWFELGNAASGELDFALANQAYRRVLELAPNNASLLVMVGRQYQGLRQLDEARAAFERAVAADPASVDARISLAVWFEKERRLEDAWECVEACLARHPRDDQARYFRAFLLHRKGRNTEAETALRDLIKGEPQYPYVKYASRHLLGVVLDQLGQYAEAMRWLCESKAQVRRIIDTARLEEGYDRVDRARRELLTQLTPEQLRRWCQEPPASTCAWQAGFLGGHPRSGTTLIEQILDAHPEVLAFDESEAIGQEDREGPIEARGEFGLFEPLTQNTLGDGQDHRILQGHDAGRRGSGIDERHFAYNLADPEPCDFLVGRRDSDCQSPVQDDENTLNFLAFVNECCACRHSISSADGDQPVDIAIIQYTQQEKGFSHGTRT